MKHKETIRAFTDNELFEAKQQSARQLLALADPGVNGRTASGDLRRIVDEVNRRRKAGEWSLE